MSSFVGNTQVAGQNITLSSSFSGLNHDSLNTTRQLSNAGRKVITLSTISSVQPGGESQSASSALDATSSRNSLQHKDTASCIVSRDPTQKLLNVLNENHKSAHGFITPRNLGGKQQVQHHEQEQIHELRQLEHSKQKLRQTHQQQMQINLSTTSEILKEYPPVMPYRTSIYTLFSADTMQNASLSTPQRPLPLKPSPSKHNKDTIGANTNGLRSFTDQESRYKGIVQIDASMNKTLGSKDFYKCPSTSRLLAEFDEDNLNLMQPAASSQGKEDLIIFEQGPKNAKSQMNQQLRQSRSVSHLNLPASSTTHRKISKSDYALVDELTRMTPHELASALAKERERNSRLALELSVIVKASMGSSSFEDSPGLRISQSNSLYGGGNAREAGQSQLAGCESNDIADALNTQLQRALSRLAKLQETTESQKERILSGEFALAELENKRSRLEHEVKSLEEARTNWLLEREDFVEKTRDLESRLSDCTRQLQAAQTEVHRLRAEHENERARQEAATQLLRAEVEALDAKRVALIAQSEALMAEGRAARKAQAEAQSEASLAKAELAQGRKELADAQTARASLLVELGISNERIDVLEQKLANAERELAKRIQELSELNLELIRVKREAKAKQEDLKTRLDTLTRELASVERANTILHQELDSTRETLETERQRIDALNERIELSDEREEALKVIIQQRETSLSDVTDKKTACDQTILELKQDITRREALEISHKEQIARLQDTITLKYEPLVKSHSELQTKHSELENKHGAMVRTVSVINKALNDTKAQNAELTQKLETSERSANALAASKAMLQNQVMHLKSSSKN